MSVHVQLTKEHWPVFYLGLNSDMHHHLPHGCPEKANRGYQVHLIKGLKLMAPKLSHRKVNHLFIT